MKLVCISDTHGKHESVTVPDGDVLVHAGDSTNMGYEFEIERFLRWYGAMPHEHKILIAGNHDWCFENNPTLYANMCASHCVIYLQDQATIIDGVKFYGSPWQPEFCGWAFNLERGPALAGCWAEIPDDTQVLITHGPRWGALDLLYHGERVGCADLAKRIETLTLKAHVFGHVHCCYGRVKDELRGTELINASICNEAYEPVNAPIVIEI